MKTVEGQSDSPDPLRVCLGTGIDAALFAAFKSVLVDTALRFIFLMVSTCFNTLTFQYILIPVGTVCPNHDAGGFRLEELVKQKECPHSAAGRTDKILCLHSLLSNYKGFCQVASDKLSASPWPSTLLARVVDLSSPSTPQFAAYLDLCPEVFVKTCGVETLHCESRESSVV